MHLFVAAHLEEVCPACRRTHDKKWRSEWHRHDHYKTTECECGYKIHFKTAHMHSGHH